MKAKNAIRIFLAFLFLGVGLLTTPSAKAQVYTNTRPLFGYAVFYNGLLEFSDSATMTINGRVHGNSNIYLGTPSGSTLTFNFPVTSSGMITNPPNVGMAQSQWTGTTTYNGTPGWMTNVPPLTLPMSTNSYREIIQLPAPGEDAGAPTNSLSQQRYYYKAGLVILVTNITTALNGTNVTNVLTTVRMKGSMFDSSPLVVSYTNNLPTNTGALWTNYLRMTTNWNWYGCGTWLSTNVTFYDARQNQTNLVTQIDVGKFGTWIATNTNALAKWNGSTPFNGIVYVADYRTTNGMYMDCVRLTNGQTIPSIGASNISGNTNYAYTIPGLSVATVNPLYIVGLYNCPGTSNVNSNNTAGTRPCSVVCDALTILSPAWTDPASFSFSVPNANNDTVNTAIITGNVPSTGTGVTTFSGGIHNLPRLLENWAGDTLWLNTSLACLYSSAQSTHQFEQPAAYYLAPTRRFSFDQNLLNTFGLPPGTPIYSQVVTPVTINATVSLSNLEQVYNGTALAATVETVPAGLAVSLQYSPGGCGIYFPSATNAGMYVVIATVTATNYSGTASNYFYIDRAPATVNMSNLVQTFDGTFKHLSLSTTPPGLGVFMTYDGHTIYSDASSSPTVGLAAGSYSLIGTIDDYNYQGSATNTFVILPANVAVNFFGLSQVYDGTAKSVGVTTTPPGITVDVTYNGSTNAPTEVGSYTVIGTVDFPNHQGSATNLLVIAPPAQMPIMVTGTTLQTDGTFQLSFTNTPGMSFTVLGSSDPTASLTNWTLLGTMTENPAGQFQFTDMQATNTPLQFYMIRSP